MVGYQRVLHNKACDDFSAKERNIKERRGGNEGMSDTWKMGNEY